MNFHLFASFFLCLFYMQSNKYLKIDYGPGAYIHFFVHTLIFHVNQWLDKYLLFGDCLSHSSIIYYIPTFICLQSHVFHQILYCLFPVLDIIHCLNNLTISKHKFCLGLQIHTNRFYKIRSITDGNIQVLPAMHSQNIMSRSRESKLMYAASMIVWHLAST